MHPVVQRLLRNLGLGILAPAAVACGVALVLRRLFRLELRERWEASLAIAGGYVAGYLLNPSLTDLEPTRNWHWTLYLVAAAGVIGPLCATPRIPAIVRWLLAAAMLISAAYLLTPTWASLWPPRIICIPLLAGYFILLAATFHLLAARIPPVQLLGAVTATLLTVTMVIASAVALVNAEVAVFGFGAAAGYSLLAWRTNAPRPLGFAVLYTVLAGGWAFFGAMQPNPAKWGLLLAPFAPAAFWLGAWKPLAGLNEKTRSLVLGALVLMVLAMSVALVEGR